MDLLAWYNLIFVAPVGLAGVYLALSATGLGDLSGESDVDADADADFDHDVDLDMDHDVDLDMDHDLDVDMDHDVDFDMDHDVDADLDADADMDLDHDIDLDPDHDVDADVDHDLDIDHDADVEAEADAYLNGHDVDHDVHGSHELGAEHEAHDFASSHEPSLLIRALSILGFGKVPVSILMTCLMVIFGATGLMANGIFETMMPWSWAPNVYFWPSLGLALLASFGLTGSLARGINRIMPTRETYAVTEEELVGQVGVSVYGIRDDHRGPVNVKDTGGTLHQVMGRTMDGTIPRGTEVLLVRYHRKEDYYDVATSPLSATAGGAGQTAPAREAEEERSQAGESAQNVQTRRDGERTSSTQS